MNKEPDWEKIEMMNPKDAFMEGYKKGREDSKDLRDDMMNLLEKGIGDLKKE